jgi:hypothetical protein
MKRARVIQPLHKSSKFVLKLCGTGLKNSRKLVKEAIDLVKDGNEVSEQNNWSKTQGRS